VASLESEQLTVKAAHKKLQQCESQIKIVYQELVKTLLTTEEKIEAGTRKSSLEVDTTNPTVVEAPERLELTID